MTQVGLHGRPIDQARMAMLESHQGEQSTERFLHAPKAYLDMSIEERRLLLARLHAQRSQEMAQAISRLFRAMLRPMAGRLGKVLRK